MNNHTGFIYQDAGGYDYVYLGPYFGTNIFVFMYPASQWTFTPKSVFFDYFTAAGIETYTATGRKSPLSHYLMMRHYLVQQC